MYLWQEAVHIHLMYFFLNGIVSVSILRVLPILSFVEKVICLVCVLQSVTVRSDHETPLIDTQYDQPGGLYVSSYVKVSTFWRKVCFLQKVALWTLALSLKNSKKCFSLEWHRPIWGTFTILNINK